MEILQVSVDEEGEEEEEAHGFQAEKTQALEKGPKLNVLEDAEVCD